MTWSAAQYLQFEDERTRPVRDLVAAIPTVHAERVVDLGCGPGNSTEVLAARYPDARMLAVDSSADMIAAAKKRLPAATWELELADVQSWSTPGPFDVILANAVFQWVPGHQTLFPELVAKLAPGGSLAVQMPDNLAEPTHRLMYEVAESGPWADELRVATAGTRAEVGSAEWYFTLLRGHASRVDVWRTTYHHPLAGAHAVVEWFKGSGLRPFLAPLSPEAQKEFLGRYEAAIARAYPALADGTVLLPFPRLFVVATR